MSDTPPEIAQIVHDRFMALPGSERFLMEVRMRDAARRIVLASLPTNLPSDERKRLLFERYHRKPLPATVRKHAAKQAISENKALRKDMEEKAAEFVEKGAEVYAKA